MVGNDDPDGQYKMPPELFTLPVDAIDQVTANATQTIADVWPIAALVFGVLLGLVIISWLIGGIHVDDN